jgi:hypothetical protein
MSPAVQRMESTASNERENRPALRRATLATVAGANRSARRPSQERHRSVGAYPRPCGCEADVNPVPRVADHGKRREQVPNAAPGCGRDTPVGGHGCIEHDVNRVGRGGGYEDAKGEQGFNLRHVCNLNNGIGIDLAGGLATHEQAADFSSACGAPAPSSSIRTRCSCTPRARLPPCVPAPEHSRGRIRDRVSRG